MNDNELNLRIQELEEENVRLREWQGNINEILGQLIDMVEKCNATGKELEGQIADISYLARINRYRIDSLPYELAAPNYKVGISFPNILTISETRQKIINEGKSLARLGDGEFVTIVGSSRWNFQGPDEKLGERMKEVLASKNPNLLIGLNPNFYGSLFELDENDADSVRAYMRPMVRKLHDSLLDGRTYGNTLFHTIKNQTDVEELKSIWEGKDVVLIEGRHTKTGIGNDLLAGAKSINRILAPAENAFDVYEDILNEAVKVSKEKLYLLALGPTATVLAYDLCNEGYQAIDIGHVDLIYEKYLYGILTS